MKITNIYCLCVLIALSACSSEKPANSRVPDTEILDFLKVEFQYDRFKSLDCVGNNPHFELLETLNPQQEVVWQREVNPANADLTFRATLDIDNKDKLIVGHLNVKASHAQHWTTEIDYISFSISMNEWYFVGPGDDIDKYCD